MKTAYFIKREILEILFQEIENYSPRSISTNMKIEVLELLDRLKILEATKSTISEHDWKPLIESNFSKDPLNKLTIIKSIIETFINFKKYSDNGNIQKLKEKINDLERKIENNPKGRIYPYIWVMAKRNLFLESEYFEVDIISYLQTVFGKYKYLLDLDDFMDEWDLFSINNTSKFWNGDRITKVFEYGYQNSPNNIQLAIILGEIHDNRGNYSKALEYYHKYLTKLSDNHKAFNYTDDEYGHFLNHITIMNTLAHYYLEDKEYEKAMKFANSIIDNSSINIDNWNEETNDETIANKEYSFAISALLIRVSINLINKDTRALKRDYKILNKEWMFIKYPMYKNYPFFYDALQYITNNTYNQKVKEWLLD